MKAGGPGLDLPAHPDLDRNELHRYYAVMPEEPDNIILIQLRRMDVKLDQLIGDVGELKTRTGILEHQYASLSNRIDRIEMRLDRIEQRLDLAEADA